MCTLLSPYHTSLKEVCNVKFSFFLQKVETLPIQICAKLVNWQNHETKVSQNFIRIISIVNLALDSTLSWRNTVISQPQIINTSWQFEFEIIARSKQKIGMWRYCEKIPDVIWYCESQCEWNSAHIVTHIVRRLWEDCEQRWIPLLSCYFIGSNPNTYHM